MNDIAKRYRSCSRCVHRNEPVGRFCVPCDFSDNEFHPLFIEEKIDPLERAIQSG